MRVASSEATIQHYVETFNLAHFLNDNILSNLRLFEFPAYSNVYTEDQEQHYLYFLVEGQVQCSHYHANGRQAVFALSNPFTAIGDFEILSEERVQSNVIATRKTIMLGIAADVVRHYGEDDPRFLRFLIDQLREKLYETNALYMNQVLPVINRLALYILAHSGNNEAIVLPSKEEFASLMGTTPRHLNRVLRELVHSGAISAGYPRVRILNRLVLEETTL
jgi:CRP-like cAMP-binding protein